MALTTEIILHFHFHFKVFPERERERERERASTRLLMIELQSSPTITGEPRAPVRADLVSSSLTIAISRSTTPIAIGVVLCEIVIDASRDRVVDRDLLAFARSRRRSRSRLREIARSSDWSSRSIAPSNLVECRSLMIFFLGFFWVLSVFAGVVFSFFFSKHQKIFFGNFFEMQPNT